MNIRASKHNQCRHGDAHYIAPSVPFRGRACCKQGIFQLQDIPFILFLIRNDIFPQDSQCIISEP